MDKQRIWLIGATIGFAALFAGCIWLVGLFLINRLNESRLEAIAQTSITRTERIIDYAVIGMNDLLMQNHFGCNPADREALQRATYAAGNIRDIRLQYGSTSCWGLDSSNHIFGAALAAVHASYARNKDYQLATVDLPDWRGLMVRRSGSDWNALAVIGTAGLLFDLLPSELREHAVMDMSITDGTAFAEYHPAEAPPVFQDTRLFAAKSERYPISFSMKIDSAVLANWNQEIHRGIGAAVIALSLAFGFLAARGVVRRPSLVDDLDRAIANGEIVPHYQPLFSLVDHRMLGFEMLARWIKADGTSVSPANFIPLAENEGRVGALTKALLSQAGRDVGPMLHADPNLKMSFNITADQLLSEGFVEDLQAHVKASGLPLQSMVIEITERQAIPDTARANEVSRQLLASGMRIAIDDAGTGHNGLSSLHALNANYLKIDKYFVDGVTVNRKSSALIEMLVSIAEQFDMTVVAEGIETDAQLEALKALGIREGQGYVYSRPVAAGQLAAIALRASLQGANPGAVAGQANLARTA